MSDLSIGCRVIYTLRVLQVSKLRIGLWASLQYVQLCPNVGLQLMRLTRIVSVYYPDRISQYLYQNELKPHRST